MIHAREDYNHIQDPSGKIPENEPVILIRGQDAIGWMLLEEYIKLRRRTHFKPDDPMDEISEQLLKHADRMREWPVKKMADLPIVNHSAREENEEAGETPKPHKKKEKASLIT